MSVYITNRRDGPGTTIYCGRGSALGNPYPMKHEGQRDAVCDRYEIWFGSQVNGDASMEFRAQLEGIVQLGKIGDVSLRCFCAPARCHCETIKDHVDMLLEAKPTKL